MADETAPPFQIRARVVETGGVIPSGKTYRVGFLLGGDFAAGMFADTTDNNWSPWIDITVAEMQSVSGNPTGFPAVGEGYPVPFVPMVLVARDQSTFGYPPTPKYEFEVVFTETPGTTWAKSPGLMFWGQCTFVVRRGALDMPMVETSAEYNQRYWTQFAPDALALADRPTKVRIIDSFAGDAVTATWQDAANNLAKLGVNRLAFGSPLKPFPSTMAPTAITKFTGISESGVHVGWHEFGLMTGDPASDSPADVVAWAAQLASQYTNYGWTLTDIEVMQTMDEGAYYHGTHPTTLGIVSTVTKLNNNAAALARFRQYLQDRGLTPADVGHASWDTVVGIERNGQTTQTGSLTTRRLWYWMHRFFSWNAARWAKQKHDALVTAFHPNLVTFYNFNQYNGRIYAAGPGTFEEWDGSGSGIGGVDWFEWCREGAAGIIQPEDWDIIDSNGPHWSYRARRLAAAVKRGAAAGRTDKFGSFQVGYTGGVIPGTFTRKVHAAAGQGAWSIYHYYFGPAWASQGGAYSEHPGATSTTFYPDYAKSNQLLARSEDLTGLGTPLGSEVAILYPRSSAMWDLYDAAVPNVRVAMPGNDAMSYNSDAFAECRGLFHALQNSTVNPEFIEENDLNATALAAYSVIYLTEPNVPATGQAALAAWVDAGGTLVKLSNAGTADEYNTPTTTLNLGGVVEAARAHLITSGGFYDEPAVDSATYNALTGNVYGIRNGFTSDGGGTIEARFADNAPALVSKAVGSGRVVHFAFLPGISYHMSGTYYVEPSATGHPYKNFNEAMRQMILRPLVLAGVVHPVEVNATMIEAPVLTHTDGHKITLINWDVENVKTNLFVRYRAPFAATQVRSVTHGVLAHSETGDGLTFTLPSLDDVDVVNVYSSGEPPPASISIESWGVIPI